MLANLTRLVVVEDPAADTIALPERSPGCQRRHFESGHRLHGAPAAEEHGLPLIDDERQRPIALLGIDTDVRLARARRDVPVHGPDVVAGQVGAELFEVQAAPAHARAMTPGEET